MSHKAPLQNKQEKSIVIGLTGPIAAGKSTIASMLVDAGAELIDADRVYGSLLTAGSDLALRVAGEFGEQIVAETGEIDRFALGKMVFSDPEALSRLESITHPAIVAEVRRKLAASKAPILVIEAIKLVQAGLINDVDSLWVVTADPSIRRQRLMRRNNISMQSAQQRINASPANFLDVADVVIDNSGDLETTQRHVDRALALLQSDVMTIKAVETP